MMESPSSKRPQSRRRSPSKPSRSSSANRIRTSSGERRMPIKYISIEVEDETRDDEEINVLVTLIQQRNWYGVSARIQTQEGINEAARAQPTKDYALHHLCKCGHDYKISKYRSFLATPTTDCGSSGEISSRESSIASVSFTQSSASPSITTKDLSEEPVEESLPTRAVLEAVMNAFPKAVKLPGAGDATPLHWAVRYRYSLELLNVLIQAFPQALDMKDAGTRTPRNYAALANHVPSRSALLRPTSCWLQHLHDERVYKEMALETAELEQEVMKLCKSLETSQNEEHNLQQRVLNLEAELNSFGDLTRANGFADKASEIHEELEGSMDVIRGTLEGLIGQTMLKYADEEKERALLASFNSDVERIYNNANEGLDELSSEIQRITISLDAQRSKR